MHQDNATSIANTSSTPARPPTAWAIQKQLAPTTAAAGRVVSQATPMRPAMCHRTAAPGRPTPEPRIDPVATCVVDRAIPKWLEVRIIAAEEDSAAIPCGDSMSTSPLPRVRMIRHPPR